MTSPPDPLFREGLEHYQRPAPSSAWDRIESGLDHQKPKGLWLKIAAAILLLIGVSFALWPKHAVIPTVVSPQNEIQQPILKPETPIIKKAVEPMAVVTPKPVAPFALPKKIKILPSIASSPQKSVTEIPIVAMQEPEEKKVITYAEAIDRTEHTEPTRTDAYVTDASTPEAIIISQGKSRTYTSAEVNAKFLKPEPVAQATPEKKSASGLQKVIDLALDFKNGDSGFGDLRQKKNELLTINYPSKKRDMNK
jgi:hypothetical protein